MFIIIFTNCEGRKELVTMHNHRDAIKVYRCLDLAGFELLTAPP